MFLFAKLVPKGSLLVNYRICAVFDESTTRHEYSTVTYNGISVILNGNAHHI